MNQKRHEQGVGCTGFKAPSQTARGLAPGLTAFALLLTLVADAGEVTYRYNGTITGIAKSIEALVIPPELSNLFQSGGAWSLDFTFDSNAVDTTPDNPNLGFYQSGGRRLSFDYGNGAYVGSLSGAWLNLIVYEWPENAGSPDGFISVGVVRFAPPGSQQINFPTIAGLRMLAIEADLFDQTATVFGSDALPLGLDINDYNERAFLMDWGTTDGGPFFRVQGVINSVALVPEPSSIVLLLTGGCFLAAMRRRQARQSTAR